MSRGLEIIKRLRHESFNQETEKKLLSHPYLRAAKAGTLTMSQRRAFAREQYSIQLSDAKSFAALAGHVGFCPTTLSEVTTVPQQPNNDDSPTVDLFQFLLGGEIYAAQLLLKYANQLGLDEKSLKSPEHQLSAKAQGYPSYWARLALSKQRAAGAAACAVNFPAWGSMCHCLLEALRDCDSYQHDDDGLAFIKFFATPIEDLDLMAATIIDKEDNLKYEDLVESVRLLQEYEVMFWDAIFESK